MGVEVALAVEVMVVMTEVVGVEVGEDEGVALTVGIVVAVGVSVGLILGSGEADGDGVIVLVGTGVWVYDGVLVGMGVEVAVAGEPLADAEMRGNTIVPSDIRNPASRSIRAGRRQIVKRWLQKKMASGQVHVFGGGGFRPIHHDPPPGAPPMEGEDAD